MKAKVKSLGSVVDLSEYVYDEDGNEYTCDEIELIDDDNWHHYLIQAAIAAMQCMTSGDWEDSDGLCTPEMVAEWSVRLADALIKELKGGER